MSESPPSVELRTGFGLAVKLSDERVLNEPARRAGAVKGF